MSDFYIEPNRKTLHGHLSTKLKPVLQIHSGDSVTFKTLEGDWRWKKPDLASSESGESFIKREFPLDEGHALCGPIYIYGAKPGLTLKVVINQIIPYNWGWSRVGGGNAEHLSNIGFSGKEHFLLWDIDHKEQLCRSNEGHTVKIDPFMGVITVAPNSDYPVKTHIPGSHGGNLDCKDIIPGSTLYMPIYTEGALFSTGDGHARQGNGELGGTAIECPMEAVHITFEVIEEPFISLLCDSPRGLITFGFDKDLTNASYHALNNMVEFLANKYKFSLKEALNICGVIVDMNVTQIVNGIRGAHAILPHDGLLFQDKSIQ